MTIRDWIADYSEEALIADGFDGAIIGMCESFGGTLVVAYDKEACIEILMKEFEGTIDEDADLYTEALDYFEYNVMGAYVGEYTPVYLTLYKPPPKVRR